MNNMLENIKTPETKPFYLTTEFWGLAVLQFLTWISTLPTAGIPGGKTTVSAVTFVGYALSRGLAKSGSPFEKVEAGVQELSEEAHLPTGLPMPGTTDIPPFNPPVDGAGAKGVQQDPAAVAAGSAVAAAPPAATAIEHAVGQGAADLGSLAATIREIASEHPEVITQLKGEGVLP